MPYVRIFRPGHLSFQPNERKHQKRPAGAANTSHTEHGGKAALSWTANPPHFLHPLACERVHLIRLGHRRVGVLRPCRLCSSDRQLTLPAL
jgi:hypothetical protein